jgi:hypothetical protein
MTTVLLVLLNTLKLIVAKLAPVILHDIWNALIAAWPQIKADLLKGTAEDPKA